MRQLAAMGWETLQDEAGNHRDGDIDVPNFTFRESFREVLLREHLKAALHHINRAEDGTPWLDDDRVNQAITALERVGEPKLMESNINGTRLLLEGIAVEGDPVLHGGKLLVVFSRQNQLLGVERFSYATRSDDGSWTVAG